MHNILVIPSLLLPSSCFDLSANNVEDVLCRRYACPAYQILSLVFAEYCFPRIVMKPHLATIDTLHSMRCVCRVTNALQRLIERSISDILNGNISTLPTFLIVGYISYLHLHRKTLQELPPVLICVLMMNIFQLFDNNKKTTNKSFSNHLQLKQQCMTRPCLKKTI